MARNPAEGLGDSRTFTSDPYRRESPPTTDASAGRLRTTARSGIRNTAIGSPGSSSGSRTNLPSKA